MLFFGNNKSIKVSLSTFKWIWIVWVKWLKMIALVENAPPWNIILNLFTKKVQKFLYYPWHHNHIVEVFIQLRMCKSCWIEIFYRRILRNITFHPQPTCRPASSSCRRGPRCPSAGRCRPSAHQTPSPAPPPPVPPHPWGRWRTQPCCSGTWSAQTEICLNIIIMIIITIVLIIIIISIITWKSAAEATVPSSTIFWVRFLQGKLLVRIAARKLLFIIWKNLQSYTCSGDSLLWPWCLGRWWCPGSRHCVWSSAWCPGWCWWGCSGTSGFLEKQFIPYL